MTTQKLEYDSTLGGSVVLDSSVYTYRYAAGVLNEMRDLLAEVQNPTNTKLVFQTLPKHMRRRAMSHHAKRLPRKYRAAHCSQMAKAGKPQTTHRPSRKYRRRPGNLLREYIRRQRRHVWLETHIWHARRFHMIERWGYRLPYASCDKTYRACYRASAEHCLLQDISFYACLQLEGSMEDLRAGFARLTSNKCGMSIAAKIYTGGGHEGSIELFKDGQYPAGALGRTSFLWRPLSNSSAAEVAPLRMVWLWVHPSAYQAVFEEVIKVFELVSLKTTKVLLPTDEEMGDEVKGTLMEEAIQQTEASDDQGKATATMKPRVKAQRQLRFMTRTLAYERIKRYSNAQQTVRLSELKDTMNRFRLTGPLSQSLLAQAFKVKPASTPCESKEEELTNWFDQRQINDGDFHAAHAAQTSYWEKCSQQISCPTELLSHLVLALNIEDPRIHRPQKRTKVVPTAAQATAAAAATDLLIDVPNCLAESALWDQQLRDHIGKHMLGTQAYCELRAKHVLIPGAACRFEQQLQPVPVLLIQRPGSQLSQYKRLGYGCGWDVIVPAGYGMPIWLSLIMWGARAGGLREFDSVARESGTEQHLPDTVAGQQVALGRYTELSAKYFRLPPNKRCNYRKFAIASPFRAPFAQLARDWRTTPTPDQQPATTTTGSGFYVLRERELLQELQLCLTRRQHAFPASLSSDCCLIQLQLCMKARGNVTDFGLICLPTRADLKRNLKQMQRNCRAPIYTEPLLADVHERTRKRLRQQHKRLLKRLRGRRVREKRRKQETSNTRVHIRPANTASLVASQFSRMCQLWLPDDACDTLYSVRKQCTREVFGYVSTASFSYTEATVCAIGYVTAEGLRQLLLLCQQAHLKHPMCLLRGTNTRHYRFATFKLNLHLT